jgi:DNA-binding FadR family transcriptional regulator
MIQTGSRARSIPKEIAHEIGVAIVGSRLLPGDTLVGEERFSTEKGISRSAYREAIRILEAKGLVASRRKTGTHVRTQDRWNTLDVDVLSWAFEAGPSWEFVRDIFDLRRVVGPEAAAFAALRRDGSDLALMGHALQEMGTNGLHHPKGHGAEETFHRTLLCATKNAPLIALSSSFAVAVKWTTTYSQKEKSPLRDPMPDYFSIYEAIAQRDDANARIAMAYLIENAAREAALSRQIAEFA